MYMYIAVDEYNYNVSIMMRMSEVVLGTGAWLVEKPTLGKNPLQKTVSTNSKFRPGELSGSTTMNLTK